MAKKTVFCALLTLLLVGCGTKHPYTSGGRTAAYWAEALKQPDVELRRKAAVKIGPLLGSDAAALPASIEALKDEDTQVRLAAIRTLKIYVEAKHAQEALAALREVQEKDAEPAAREAAAKAVEALKAKS